MCRYPRKVGEVGALKTVGFEFVRECVLGFSHRGDARLQGADTLKSDALSRRAVASPHWVCMGAAVASSDCSGSGWGDANADPMQRRDGRHRWLLRRWECVPSLNGGENHPIYTLYPHV